MDLLNTLKSLEIGLVISISFFPCENCLSIRESVNDQVTASRYPLFATALWDR